MSKFAFLYNLILALSLVTIFAKPGSAGQSCNFQKRFLGGNYYWCPLHAKAKDNEFVIGGGSRRDIGQTCEKACVIEPVKVEDKREFEETETSNNNPHPNDKAISIIPIKNNPWVDLLANENVSKADVYTTQRLKWLSTPPDGRCEDYGLVKSFFDKLFAVTKSKEISVVVIISEKAIGRSTETSTKGFAHEVFFLKQTNDGSCTIKSSIEDNLPLVRLAASSGEHRVTIAFMEKTGSSALAGQGKIAGLDSIKSTLTGQFSALATTLGKLLGADGITFLNNNENFRRGDRMYFHSGGRTDGNYGLDVQIGSGKGKLRFTILQDAEVDKLGDLAGKIKLADTLEASKIVVQNDGDPTPKSKKLKVYIFDKTEVDLATAFKPIGSETADVYLKRIDMACDKIRTAFTNTGATVAARTYFLTLVLQEVPQKFRTDLLDNPNYKNVCLNSFRERSKIDNFEATLRGQDVCPTGQIYKIRDHVRVVMADYKELADVYAKIHYVEVRGGKSPLSLSKKLKDFSCFVSIDAENRKNKNQSIGQKCEYLFLGIDKSGDTAVPYWVKAKTQRISFKNEFDETEYEQRIKKLKMGVDIAKEVPATFKFHKSRMACNAILEKARQPKPKKTASTN